MADHGFVIPRLTNLGSSIEGITIFMDIHSEGNSRLIEQWERQSIRDNGSPRLKQEMSVSG